MENATVGLIIGVWLGVFISLILLRVELKKIVYRDRAQRDIGIMINRLNHLLRYQIIPTLEYSQTGYPTDKDKEKFIKTFFKSDYILRRYYTPSVINISVSNGQLKLVILLFVKITIHKSLRYYNPLSLVG